jgi:hypothetical protein
MLSFELRPKSAADGSKELEIYCDGAGLASLMAQLRFLVEQRTDHVELMSPSWGGSHLTDNPQHADHLPIRFVKILLR